VKEWLDNRPTGGTGRLRGSPARRKAASATEAVAE
jgi:hypothetical protein